MKYINPQTDGKFYTSKEMVLANCQDCQGCWSCCHDMGESILLDPYDVYQLQKNEMDIARLLTEKKLGLTLQNGLVVPCMQMEKDRNCCSFLDKEKRCSIHEFRPGICRLFPLGRDYQEGQLSYILLKDACRNKNRTEVRVEDWIQISHMTEYEAFLLQWHDFRKQMEKLIMEASKEEANDFANYLLQLFFLKPYAEDFYGDFQSRIKKIQKLF